MNDILARRARRATAGIALSAALVAGIAPVTTIAAETSSPTGAVALQTEDAATAREKAYAAMQEALKNLEAAKDAAGPEILETIEHVITDLQSLRDRMLKEADDSRDLFFTYKRTSMQPKPNTMRPTTGQAAFRQN